MTRRWHLAVRHWIYISWMAPEHRKYAGSYIDSTAIPLIQLVYNQIAKGSNLSAVVNKHAGFQLVAALLNSNR